MVGLFEKKYIMTTVVGEVAVRSIGHEKLHIIVMLCAQLTAPNVCPTCMFCTHEAIFEGNRAAILWKAHAQLGLKSVDG